MISIDKLKISLGHNNESFSNLELEKLRLDMYQLADMAFEQWRKTKQIIEKSN